MEEARAGVYCEKDSLAETGLAHSHINNRLNERSARRRCKHYALAVVRRSQNFLPRHSPLPGVQDGQNLISWRWSLPLSTEPVWWGSMHAISSYRGNRSTNTHKQKNNQTGSITLHCTAKLSTQCNMLTVYTAAETEGLTVRMPCQRPTSRLKSSTHTITSPARVHTTYLTDVTDVTVNMWQGCHC